VSLAHCPAHESGFAAANRDPPPPPCDIGDATYREWRRRSGGGRGWDRHNCGARGCWPDMGGA
jgi:hypothetical protein